MFKNGYPMSYGGAWLFGRRALVGINIFEAFRGGESAFVFAQLLRCYKMAFGAAYFEVEPYQFGKNNPEGIRSGAFWFYHRFGFRPVDGKLRELADMEYGKISQTKGYRTPPETLKRLTGSNLYVFFDKGRARPINPSLLSEYVTQCINNRYNGDRNAALRDATKRLRALKIVNGKTSPDGLNKMALFAFFCVDLNKLTPSGGTALAKIIHEKGQSEFGYIHALHAFAFENHVTSGVRDFERGLKTPNLR
jgi:hypothetical protein